MEARVRALTREVGTLKEELRRETKRRERASERCQECEVAKEAAEGQVKELKYSNRRLAEDLNVARESSKRSADANRVAIASLREGLASVESTVADRAAQSYERMQSIFAVTQQLQGVIFVPGNLRGNVLSEAQETFTDLLQQLSQLSGHLALGTNGPDDRDRRAASPRRPSSQAAPAEPSPVITRQLQADNSALRAQVASLETQLAAARNGASSESALQTALSQVEGLIPQYRQALGKLKAQALTMKDRLEVATAERRGTSQEIASLRAALRERDSALQRRDAEQAQVSSVVRQQEADIIAVSTEAETSRLQLEEELRRVQERVIEVEELHARTCADYQAKLHELQGAYAEEKRSHERSQSAMAQLQGTIGEQQSDLQAALDLVTRKTPSHASSRAARSSPTRGLPDPLPAAKRGSVSPTHAASAEQIAHKISRRLAGFKPAGYSQPGGSPGHTLTAYGPYSPSGAGLAQGALPGPSLVSSSRPHGAIPSYPPGWNAPPLQRYAAQETAPHAKAASISFAHPQWGADCNRSRAYPSPPQPGVHLSLDVAQMRREMEALDTEIAGLESSIQEAVTRFG